VPRLPIIEGISGPSNPLLLRLAKSRYCAGQAFDIILFALNLYASKAIKLHYERVISRLLLQTVRREKLLFEPLDDRLPTPLD